MKTAVADNPLSIAWEGDRSQELRLRFAIEAVSRPVKVDAVAASR